MGSNEPHFPPPQVIFTLVNVLECPTGFHCLSLFALNAPDCRLHFVKTSGSYASLPLDLYQTGHQDKVIVFPDPLFETLPIWLLR